MRVWSSHSNGYQRHPMNPHSMTSSLPLSYDEMKMWNVIWTLSLCTYLDMFVYPSGYLFVYLWVRITQKDVYESFCEMFER